jgi:hypothetical protein
MQHSALISAKLLLHSFLRMTWLAPSGTPRYLKIAFRLAFLQKRKNKIGVVGDMPAEDSFDA